MNILAFFVWTRSPPLAEGTGLKMRQSWPTTPTIALKIEKARSEPDAPIRRDSEVTERACALPTLVGVGGSRPRGLIMQVVMHTRQFQPDGFPEVLHVLFPRSPTQLLVTTEFETCQRMTSLPRSRHLALLTPLWNISTTCEPRPVERIVSIFVNLLNVLVTLPVPKGPRYCCGGYFPKS